MADGLPDRSGMPGEAMCMGPVPDMQRIAGTEVEINAEADNPSFIKKAAL
ncbi:MAG: hypothetical protein ABJB11_09175 [Ferruginibacter sp.]